MLKRMLNRDVAGLVACLLFLVFELGWIGWVLQHEKLVDYYAYDVAAIALSRGENPYALAQAEANAIAVERKASTTSPVPPYLYSPFLASALLPLTWLPVSWAALIWSLGSLAALVMAGVLLSRLLSGNRVDPEVFGGLTLFVPVLTTFYAGQVNHYLLLTIVLAAYGVSRGHDRRVGLAVAVGILLKTMPVVLAGWLFLRRQWKALLWMVGGVLVLVLLTGPAMNVEYAYRAFALAGGKNVVSLPVNQSLPATIARLTPDGLARPLGLGLSGLVMLLTLAATMLRRERDPLASVSAIISATLLAAPLVWIHHQVLLSLPMVAILRSTREERPWVGRALVTSAVVLIDTVALAWKPLQAWPVLVSLGTLGGAIIWAASMLLVIRPEKGSDSGLRTACP